MQFIMYLCVYKLSYLNSMFNTHVSESSFTEPPRQTSHSHKHEEAAHGFAMGMGDGEELPYFSASSSNMNMRIVPGAVTFQNIDEMTKVRYHSAHIHAHLHMSMEYIRAYKFSSVFLFIFFFKLI